MIDLTPAVHTWQIRLYNQVEQGRTAVDGLITGIWGRVVAAMLAPSPDRARILAYHALVELRTVPQLLRSRLTAVADAAADHTTRTLIAAGGVITEAAKPFRKPTKARAAELVHNTGWEARMNQLTRLADPRQLAEAIAQGVAAGEAPAKLAKRIRPLVGNVASAARRVARTEAIRVAHEIELEGYEQLGDMVVGYQVHALLDQVDAAGTPGPRRTAILPEPGRGRAGHGPDAPAAPGSRRDGRAQSWTTGRGPGPPRSCRQSPSFPPARDKGARGIFK